MRSRPAPNAVALVVALLAGAGCGQELGPETWRGTGVVGSVRVGDRPVGGGWIEFLPIDGTVGSLRTAPIGPDGRFVATGVPVGLVGIRLVGFPPINPMDPRVGAFLGQVRQVYLIRREIPGADPVLLDIDLSLEAYRMLDGS